MSRPPFTEKRPTAVFDTECLQNYWSIGFRCIDTQRTKVFELFEGNPLDRQGIATIIRKWRIIGFNSERYDIPMLALAMSGAENSLLKSASDLLILTDLRPWQFCERFDVSIPAFLDHIDLMQVSPGFPAQAKFGPSLKIYAGRMHSRKMQEMPVEHDEWVTPETREIIRGYHGNDLDVTRDFALELKKQLELRAIMSVEYGIDLRSKSDAQMAEAIIKKQLEQKAGRRIYSPEIYRQTFRFTAPAYVQFQTREMQELLDDIHATNFVVDGTGVVNMPDSLDKREVKIGNTVYRLGLGGLHSSEKSVFYESNDEFDLIDTDVTSYYPWLILRAGLVPKHLGQGFLDVYRSIVERRMKAKEAGQKDVAESLKIVVNGTFGKLGNAHSIMYAPNLMVQVTLSGQLSILMLIEALELAGIPVVSANTDGFVSKVPKHMRDKFFAIRFDWECDSGLTTEEKEYKGLYSRDVNDYIAIPKKGDVKLKGAYGESGPGQPGAAGLKKNPVGEVSVLAVIDFLKNGTPIEQFIEDCWDIRQFLVVRKINKGAEKDGKYIGKSIRWYYSTQETGPLLDMDSGNKIPKSDGAKPMLELSDVLPADIDYDRYVREAYGILEDIGYSRVDPKLRGRTGIVLARMPDSKSIHSLNLATGLAACGAQPKSVRDAWIEYKVMPDGHRFCPKCKKDEL